MKIDQVEFKGLACFQDSWATWGEHSPITLIIGRNNTGKSTLLDFVELTCQWTMDQHERPTAKLPCTVLFSGKLPEPELKKFFSPNSSSHGSSRNELTGNHWQAHGQFFANQTARWETTRRGSVDRFLDFASEACAITPARENSLKAAVQQTRPPLDGKVFKRILADRDVAEEPAADRLELQANGRGATNIIRRYITASHLPRDLVQTELRDALNEVFGDHGHFDEIAVQQLEDKGGNWEIFFGEKKKGLIPLSDSGSGLKTVILVLLNLIVLPAIENKPLNKYVFAFEELENNLHPGLYRRLLAYIEKFALEKQCTFFLTTHSSVALDVFGANPNAKIIRVSHDGASARTEVVSAEFDRISVASELGARPSDLLQANGIVWVEGPSDCVYLNKWIELASDGTLQEGRDYQCAFYGGSLLARTQFRSQEEAERHIVNLFRINPNIVVVCDGDRAAKGLRMKDRVRRIHGEVRKIPGSHIWVTQGREIENYLPKEAIQLALGKVASRDPEQYEPFFPRKKDKTKPYMESVLKLKTLDKMQLAIGATKGEMTLARMSGRFDWDDEMRKIVHAIRSWNA